MLEPCRLRCSRLKAFQAFRTGTDLKVRLSSCTPLVCAAYNADFDGDQNGGTRTVDNRGPAWKRGR